MAKSRKRPDGEDDEIDEVEIPESEKKQIKFRVHCECPTPLASNPLSVEASSEQVAVKKFFEANGISGSDHKITCEPE